MSVTYSAAPQVANIASKLIDKDHPHLIGIHVEYVFRSEHAERHGHVVLGKARKVSGLNAFLVGRYRAEVAELDGSIDEPFFVIEIAGDLWRVMDAKEREALVDHELSHCRTKLNKDLELQLFVAPHDVEEFSSVLARHGLWRPNLRSFLKAAKAGQPTLWSELDDEDPDNPSVVTEAGDIVDSVIDAVEPVEGGDVTITANGRSVTTSVEGLERTASRG